MGSPGSDKAKAEELVTALVESVCALLAEAPPGVREALSRAEAEGLCAALADDLASARTRGQRRFLSRWVPASMNRGATVLDLRNACRQVRQALLARGSELVAVSRDGLEDWLHEFAFGVARGVIVRREGQLLDQEAKLEIQRAELESARAEQSRLGDYVQDLWLPITPIYSGVLLLPLVGELTDERADKLGARLLNEIARHEARIVLFDMNGISAIDAQTAAHLAHLAAAVDLSGAQLVLVGIQPSVARAIVRQNLGVQAMTTRRNLHDGLTWALRQLGHKIVKSAPSGARAEGPESSVGWRS